MADPYLTPEQVKNRLGDSVDGVNGWEDERIEALVARFEDVAERYLGCAYTEREATQTVRPGHRCEVCLDNPYVVSIDSVTVDGVAWSGDIEDIDFDGPTGIIFQPGWGGRKVVIGYTHGQEAPPALLDACAAYVQARYIGETSARNPAVESFDDGSGYSYTVGRADFSAGRPTGLVVVDDALNELENHRIPGIA